VAFALMRTTVAAPPPMKLPAIASNSNGRSSRSDGRGEHVRASATLFATAASKADDREVLAGCLQVLQHFTGDCVYTPGAEGSAGYVAGVDSQPIALQGPDLEVLRRCGVDLERIFAG